MLIFNKKGSLDPVKALNDSADLVQLLGAVQLRDGKSLVDILTFDGLSLWEVFSPEIAHSHIPRILANSSFFSFSDTFKPALLTIREKIKLRSQVKKNSQVRHLLSSFDQNILCLGFTNQMYRDVIYPVVQEIKKSDLIGVSILNLNGIGSNIKYIDNIEPISIWRYWDEGLNLESKIFKDNILKIWLEINKLDWVESVIPRELEHYIKDFKNLIKILFQFYLPNIVPQLLIARKNLNIYKPKLVISPDVSDSRARLYTMQANLYNIPTLDIQFGLAGDEAVEWRFLASNKVAAWGARSKEAIMRQGVAEKRVIITGSPRHDYNFDLSEIDLLRKKELLGIHGSKKIFLLASTYSLKSHSSYSDPNILLQMKKAIFDSFKEMPNSILIIKPHPVEMAKSNRHLFKGQSNIIEVDKNLDIRDLIKVCDCFISFGSTATIDALLADKPTVCPIFPNWIFSEIFDKSGAVFTPKSRNEIIDLLKKIESEFIFEGIPSKESKKIFLENIIYSSDKNAASRIEKLIYQMIGEELHGE